MPAVVVAVALAAVAEALALVVAALAPEVAALAPEVAVAEVLAPEVAVAEVASAPVGAVAAGKYHEIHSNHIQPHFHIPLHWEDSKYIQHKGSPLYNPGILKLNRTHHHRILRSWCTNPRHTH